MATTARNPTSAKIYQNRLDLLSETRNQVVALLNQTLTLTLDLKSQVKQAHWNVKGMNFYQLHQLFDAIASQVEEYSDLIAERVTSLGGTAMGTIRIAAEASTLPEYPFEIIDGKDHVIAIADRLALYGKTVREAIDQSTDLKDAGTADLYTEISRAIDKYLWLLESHLIEN